MTLSTLMLLMRVGRSNAEALAVAADLAAQFGPRIVGVAARQASAHAAVRGAGPFEPVDHDPRKFVAEAAAAEAEFRAALGRVAPLDWRMQITSGPACDFVAAEARSADLVVVPVDGHERSFFPSGEAEVGDLLMRLGRPILTAPSGGAGFRFGRALVCFKDVREARRALLDSVVVLRAMQTVEVVEIVESGTPDDATRRLADVRDWLARHGVEADCHALAAQGGVAKQLAALAAERQPDLIVAGAFGHSRMLEWAFGGVTRELLLRSDRCVLASH